MVPSRLIGLITNLVFYQRWAVDLVAPGARHHPWWLVLGAPVVGGLVVGLMARFGSEKIRGHGMPEAIEAILIRGSRVEPKVAISSLFRRRSASERVARSAPRAQSS